jgi:hypothetical protein
VYWFSRKQRVAQGAFARGEIVFRQDGSAEILLSWKIIHWLARNNVENVLVRGRRGAALLARLPRLLKGVSSFAGWSTGWNSSPNPRRALPTIRGNERGRD